MRIGKRSRTARAEAQYTISMRFADDSVVEITVRNRFTTNCRSSPTIRKPTMSERSWEPPQWMNECIDTYMNSIGRPPTTAELMAWREGVASCRMERER